VDTYTRVAAVKLYTDKNALVSAGLLNDRVLPLFSAHDIYLLRILTDKGTEYCGKKETHSFQLYLNIEGIEHTRTQAYSPQTNRICERFHKTIKNECYDRTFRNKIDSTLDELQMDMDEWITWYNRERCHSGKHCYGKTPWQTWLDSLAKEKQLDSLFEPSDSQTTLSN